MTDLLYDPYALGLQVAYFRGEEARCHCIYPERHPNGDQNPSAMFNVRTGLYHCFSCGAGTNVTGVAKLTGGLIRKGHINYHQHAAAARREAPGEPEVVWQRLLSYPVALGNAYLHKRGFTDDYIKAFDVRANDHAVIFPIVNFRGVAEGAVVRYLSGRIRYRTFGPKHVPWGLHQKLTIDRPLWVVEGPFGAIRAISAGLQAVAVNGALVPHSMFAFLSGFKVNVVFDNDRAGYLGAARLVRTLPRAEALVPGQEADELDTETWKTIGQLRHLEWRPSVLTKFAATKRSG